jgi:hypothetical protein
LGIKPGDGLHVTPVFGSTLLHLAIEYDDIDVARWLVQRGADANAKAAVDADGFGGHTPLFHAVVTLAAPDDSKARLLLERGATPNARATIRKQLRDMGDPEKETMREFHDVTPIGYARQFQEPTCAGLWGRHPGVRSGTAAWGEFSSSRAVPTEPLCTPKLPPCRIPLERLAELDAMFDRFHACHDSSRHTTS